MTTYDHVLTGCTPVPLAGYLKALGVLRLVAEQADENARGFWLDERFVLRTKLTEEELIRFLVENYRPTPVVAPWNGGSGFWPKDNLKGLNAIKASQSVRSESYKDAIRFCEELIAARGLSQAPKEEEKAAFITDLRAGLSDEACRWLDGAIALTTEGPRYPPILGTGGNDGRLDFSNNFMQRLVQVLQARPEANAEMLRASLFHEPSANLEKGAVGQFSPGSAGGVNASAGFEAESRVNPWDFILTIEGALVFAAAAVRRYAEDRVAAFSFPFTTRMVGAGSGTTAFADEPDSRAEFWAPFWSRVATFEELLQLMSEGRAVLSARAARDGLDFARAATELGVARGIDVFIRHGFLMRAGKAYFATPLGRVRVKENPRASLISELDSGGWLSRARDVTRYAIKNGKIDRSKEAPPSLRLVGRNLDEALFRLAADGSAEALQEALIGLGALMRSEAQRPNLRTTLPPPPRLSEEWTAGADDGSHEFALAAALASIDANDEKFRLPFRRHLAPLDWDEKEGWWVWGKGTEAQALAVWFGRHLVRDMASVLERRLIEAQRHSFANQEQSELPLRGWRAAPLASIAAFVAGNTDDSRIAALASGLAWAKARRGAPQSAVREDALPFAYRALKPLFAPNGVGPEGEKRLLDPLPLVRLIRAGRIDDAVARAQAMACGAGLPAPFARQKPASMVDPERLAAALLFPLAPEAYQPLIERAYPNLSKDKENEIHAA
jgi:CRISPR-associated protein Csx17